MKLISGFIFLFIGLIFSTIAKAKLTPDPTLGEMISIVNAIDELNDRIDNDAVRGTNLFCSFTEFNVGEAGGGGSIVINAENFNLTDKSVLLAVINEGVGSIDSQAENIDINVIDTVKTTNSFIGNVVQPEAIGNGGDINIKTGSLFTDDSVISTSPVGQGSAGNITLIAQNLIYVDKGSRLFNNTKIYLVLLRLIVWEMRVLLI